MMSNNIHLAIRIEDVSLFQNNAALAFRYAQYVNYEQKRLSTAIDLIDPSASLDVAVSLAHYVDLDNLQPKNIF